MVATVEKKVIAKERRGRAIARYERWLSINPTAPLELRVKKFDRFCDAEATKK